MKNIFKYASYILCVTAIFILLKPVFFYVKGFIIQNKLEYEWTQTIKNKKININDNLIYPIGRININEVDLSSIITGGDLKKSLEVSIGHIPYTSKPGELGNVCLAGHRDTFFKKLEHVEIDDIIEIEHLKGTNEYKVQDIKIIQPDETNYLYESNEETLTLITCYPFEYLGNAPLRYIVIAKLFNI
tara:strand:+ start:1535 stop:2095 length:561 start_codon:yes stop_codon:yes gene_type:complete